MVAVIEQMQQWQILVDAFAQAAIPKRSYSPSVKIFSFISPKYNEMGSTQFSLLYTRF